MLRDLKLVWENFILTWTMLTGKIVIFLFLILIVYFSIIFLFFPA